MLRFFVFRAEIFFKKVFKKNKNVEQPSLPYRMTSLGLYNFIINIQGTGSSYRVCLTRLRLLYQAEQLQISCHTLAPPPHLWGCSHTAHPWAWHSPHTAEVAPAAANAFWHERWFRKRVSGKPKWPLFSSVNFFLFSKLITFLPEGKVLRFWNFECMHELPKEGDLW